MYISKKINMREKNVLLSSCFLHIKYLLLALNNLSFASVEKGSLTFRDCSNVNLCRWKVICGKSQSNPSVEKKSLIFQPGFAALQ